MVQNNNSIGKQNDQKSKVLLRNSMEALAGNQMPKKQVEALPHIQEMFHQKEQVRQRVQEFYNARYNELHNVYSHKDKQADEEIEQIRLTLNQLAQKIKNFNQEVYKATLTPIIQTKTGIYYKSFLSHIKEVIEVLKQQVDDAGSWLAVYKRRCKSKGAYMQGVQKKGAQYMLSEERGLATSIG